MRFLNYNLKTNTMSTNNFSKTGDRCPISGEWVALEDTTRSVYLIEGDEMPSYKGRSVSWQLKNAV